VIFFFRFVFSLFMDVMVFGVVYAKRIRNGNVNPRGPS
jgi:hypothetical protein